MLYLKIVISITLLSLFSCSTKTLENKKESKGFTKEREYKKAIDLLIERLDYRR
jgi:hypothetical protein